MVVVVTSSRLNRGAEYPLEFSSKKSDLTVRSNHYVQVGACIVIFPVSDVS